MRARAWMLGMLAAACGASGVEPADGGTPDAGPARFEVRLERAPGVALEDGDSLVVEIGCQGGAHTYLDVVAQGESLERADLTLELVGGESGPIRLRMERTSEGAELRTIFLVVADYTTPQFLGLPRDAEIRATVTGSDGRAVTVERTVQLVQGMICPPFCEYVTIEGTARITSVAEPTTAGCEPVPVAVEYALTPDEGGEPEMVSRPLFVAPDCMEALGLVVDGELRATRQRIIPGTGTCTPLIDELYLDWEACSSICP